MVGYRIQIIIIVETNIRSKEKIGTVGKTKKKLDGTHRKVVRHIFQNCFQLEVVPFSFHLAVVPVLNFSKPLRRDGRTAFAVISVCDQNDLIRAQRIPGWIDRFFDAGSSVTVVVVVPHPHKTYIYIYTYLHIPTTLLR
jgi:hypothetical protein